MSEIQTHRPVNLILLEAMPAGTVTHEMPPFLMDAFKQGLDVRAYKSVRTFLALLPPDTRALVKSGELKPYPKYEPSPSFVFYNELATPEEIKRAVEYHERNRK